MLVSKRKSLVSSFLQRSSSDAVQGAVRDSCVRNSTVVLRSFGFSRVSSFFFQYFDLIHFELSECLVRFLMVLTGCCRENLSYKLFVFCSKCLVLSCVKLCVSMDQFWQFMWLVLESYYCSYILDSFTMHLP